MDKQIKSGNMNIGNIFKAQMSVYNRLDLFIVYYNINPASDYEHIAFFQFFPMCLR